MRSMFRYTLNRTHVPAIPIETLNRGSVVVNMPPGGQAVAQHAAAVRASQAGGPVRMQHRSGNNSSSSSCGEYETDDESTDGAYGRVIGSPNTDGHGSSQDSTRAKSHPSDSISHSDSSGRGHPRSAGAGSRSARQGTPAAAQGRNNTPVSDNEMDGPSGSAAGSAKPQRMLYSTLAPEVDGEIQKFMGVEAVSRVLQLSHRDQMHALLRTIELRASSEPGAFIPSAIEMCRYLNQGMLSYEQAISKTTNSRPPFVVKIMCRVALFITLMLTSLLCVAHLAHNTYLALGVLIAVTLVFFGLLEACEEVEYMGLNLTPFFRELQCSEGIIGGAAPPPPPMMPMGPPGPMGPPMMGRPSVMPAMPPQMMNESPSEKKVTGISEEEGAAGAEIQEKAESVEGDVQYGERTRMTQHELRRSNLHYRDNIRA